MMTHQGVLIVTPEYNASIPPLLKNALDWIARVRERNEPPLAAYQHRAFALSAASDRGTGGLYALLALRQVLEIGCGALVIPEQMTLARASEAFDEMDDLRDEHAKAQLLRLVQRLIEMAQELV
jgi:NAD(P)H-dependent FMN reductase